MNPADPQTDVVSAMRRIFRLEGERTMQIARLGRAPGVEDALDLIHDQLEAAMQVLSERGAAYPLHAIARRYQLSQEDYLVLQLALLPRHGVEVVRTTTDALGDPADTPRMSHALALVAEGFDDWERARAELEALPVFRERLVITRPTRDDEADPELSPSPAVLELMGLA